MIKEVVTAAMDGLGLPYAYLEFPRAEEKLYFVGERIETPQTQEDGARHGTFIISGWSYAGLAGLDEAEELIADAFEDLRVQSILGTCCIGYSHSLDVPSDVQDVCRKDFTLDYTEWIKRKEPT